MSYVKILIGIICFWFFLSLTLSYIGNDFIIDGNTTYSTINRSAFNISSSQDYEPTRTNFLDMLFRMFTFSISTALIPASLNIFISFLNWILLLLLIICVYRIANPLS